MADIHEFMPLFLPVQGALMALILSRGVRSQDADDLLQEVATLLLERIDEFERGTNFKAWAFAVTRIQIFEYWKQQRHRLRLVHCELLEGVEAEELDLFIEEESEGVKRSALRQCVERLTKSSKELVSLHYESGKSADDIAKERQMTTMSVRTMLSRIRRKLKTCVEYRIKRAGGAL